MVSFSDCVSRGKQVRLWKVLEDSHLVFRPVGGGSIDCIRYEHTPDMAQLKLLPLSLCCTGLDICTLLSVCSVGLVGILRGCVFAMQ